MPIAHLEMAAGVHDILIDGVASTITVPVPDPGTIDQASPKVGDTLTVSNSNEGNVDPSLITYLTEVDTGGGYGPAGGTNDAATYNTTGQPAGTYRRGMQIGDLPMVYTPGKAVAAGLSLVPAGVASVTANGIDTSYTFSGLDIGGPGEIFWVVETYNFTPLSISVNSGEDTDASLSTNGGSATKHSIGHVTVANGTTAEFDVNFNGAVANGDKIRVSAYRALGYTGVRGVPFISGNNASPQNGIVDVAAGGAVLGTGGGRGNPTDLALTGVTEGALFDVSTDDFVANGIENGLTENTEYPVGVSGSSPGVSCVFLSIE